jgi:molybdate transport system regulatory protein
MVKLSLRIDLASGERLGPGKVTLLEAIARTGSISGAGRALRMSYRRAWELVESLNRAFATPVVATQMGGPHGGGAVLTPLGVEIVARYRAMEDEAAQALAPHLGALDAATREMPTAKPPGQD